MFKYIALTIVVTFSCGSVFGVEFDSEKDYNVQFELSSDQSAEVKNVRIIGVTDIGGLAFLVLSSEGFGGKEREGYVSLEAVKAILPSDSMRAAAN